MYLKKKELVEWLESESIKMVFRSANLSVIRQGVLGELIDKIQSGAFDAPEHPIIQSIRDFMPTGEQQAGYDALVAWLESTTPFELDAGTEKGAEG